MALLITHGVLTALFVFGAVFLAKYYKEFASSGSKINTRWREMAPPFFAFAKYFIPFLILWFGVISAINLFAFVSILVAD